MKITQTKIEFFVTPEIKRYVFVYLVDTGKTLVMIDSGVAGNENVIEEAIISSGYLPSDLEAVFLTHAHPDHIGTAYYFRERYGTRVFASRGERAWIEDIDLQFAERPIPNFYGLAGKSTPVDHVVKDGDKVFLSDRSVIEVIGTPGHSADEVSYRIDGALFIGDSIPVKGDIPIFVDWKRTVESLDKIESMRDIDMFYPAWDQEYSRKMLEEKIADARIIVRSLRETVQKANDKIGPQELLDFVCEKMQMPVWKKNPLFAKTVACCKEKGQECYFLVDTYVDEEKGRGRYEEYILQVKPIVESFGGEYLARTENVTSLHPKRNPQRVIVLRFPSKQALNECFASKEYQEIIKKRTESVDSRALIVEA